MGRPYSYELRQLRKTYQCALKEPIEPLESFIESSYNLPLLAIGSGGSLTAACMAALFHETTGMTSKIMTPLELFSSNISLNRTAILLVTARGRNPDILTSFKHSVLSEPQQLMAICATNNSPLISLASNYKYVRSMEFNIPSGKDGFLATNSLLALTTILYRGYHDIGLFNSLLPESLIPEQGFYSEFDNLLSILERNTWFVLYGGWGLPAAMDIESKFTESALGEIHLADFRNFAHGRHNWLARNGEKTCLVCITTPEEEDIADRTMNLIPKSIPSMRVSTSYSGPIGALELLYKVLYLIGIMGDAKNIDPGKPNVPEFGRQIYHLKMKQKYCETNLSRKFKKDEYIAIRRKIPSYLQMNEEISNIWRKSYYDFIEKLTNNYFGAIIFDYDGTLCESHDRFRCPSKDIDQNLIRLLEENILIGIATGRGKSVRKEFQKIIPSKYWNNILIGYYNCSDIAPLNDDFRPIKEISDPTVINEVTDYIEHNDFLEYLVGEYEPRPNQISIIPKKEHMRREIIQVLHCTLPMKVLSQIKILESSHSIDVVASNVSKLDLISAIEEKFEYHEYLTGPINTVCIGDKGEWPGNDFELLSHPYSLSVDSVSPDPNTCWNLAPPGHRGVQATLDYFKSFIIKTNYFKINIKLMKGRP